jgi:hypothetical protein
MRVHRTEWTGPGGPDRVDRTEWTGPDGQDRVDWTGWTGPSGPDRVDRTDRSRNETTDAKIGGERERHIFSKIP